MAGFSESQTANKPVDKTVAYVRSDLEALFPTYDLIAHCLGGSEAVKAQGDKYLPRPDAANTTPQNIARYDAYKTRAVFYNITKRTEAGLLGQVFKRDPLIKAPQTLNPVVEDGNGGGIGLTQLSKDATAYAVDYGRCGLFTDYPVVTETVSKADLETGNIRPTITVHGPKNIVNWRTKKIGSKSVLCLVVLKEDYEVDDTGFNTEVATQYRELRLTDDGQYSVQLWRAPEPKGTNFVKYGEPYFPVGGDGKPLDAIPFTFIGSKNNEPSIDPAPLIDLANINVAHYCNSADYEESVYIVGQPTLVVTGLTEEWYKGTMNSNIPFGSRSGLPLPVGADAKLLQAEPNMIAKEAMEHKERQMVALGAKIVEQKQVQRTATEASAENSAEESTLVTIAKNVSAAIKFSLEWCAYFVNVPETEVDFVLNTDFEMARMAPSEVAAVVKQWQDGAITFEEMRAVLHKTGVATEEDDKAKATIEADAAAALTLAAEGEGMKAGAVADAAPAEPVGS